MSKRCFILAAEVVVGSENLFANELCSRLDRVSNAINGSQLSGQLSKKDQGPDTTTIGGECLPA
jgi:hypothetical protein